MFFWKACSFSLSKKGLAMRKIIIAGNWKMHKTLHEVTDFLHKISEWEDAYQHKSHIGIFPPSLYLNIALEQLKNNNIFVGAQNVHDQDFGAFTGEISPQMLVSVNCKYSLVGHSERRHVFGEKDEFLNNKVLALLQNKLKVVLCIGEKEQQREDDKTEEVLQTQLSLDLKKVKNKDMRNVIIAYEPVWAIGTGKTATPETAQTAHAFIREWLSDRFNADIANGTSILYGGSVKPGNIESLIRENDIDGALIGGASLKVDSFTEIIKRAEKLSFK